MWLGIKACGCVVAVAVGAPDVPARDVEQTKRGFLKEGLSVMRITWAEWETIYRPKFLRCPHEAKETP